MLALLFAQIIKPADLRPTNEYVRQRINQTLIAAINTVPQFKLYVFYSEYDSFSPQGLLWIQGATDDFTHDVEYIEVDYDKRDPSGIAEQLKIEFLPTLVFVRDGVEFCRIDRSPNVQLDVAIYRCVRSEHLDL